MTAYVHAVKMSDRDAAEFLTLYLRGDAMTWWRSYCTTNGGLTNVFATKSFKDLLMELRSDFLTWIGKCNLEISYSIFVKRNLFNNMSLCSVLPW